jgi:hypothetical protein
MDGTKHVTNALVAWIERGKGGNLFQKARCENLNKFNIEVVHYWIMA